MTDTLQWHSLHGWEPTEGTWAILWPGHYGPFTACWINGRWTMCEDIDFNNATVGVEIDLPHLATDAVPRGEDCDMTLAYMVGRGRKDDDMAVLRAENERLRNFIADFSETKFDRIDRRSPDLQDDLDPLTDYLAIEAWQEDARATLAQEGGE